jgi:thiol-disulfide isomerase/thioredoxin
MAKLMTQILKTSALILCLTGTATASASALTGAAPDFTLKSESGKNLRLSEHRGQVVMINFWASWCGPCRQEMPILDQLQQRYSKAGFTVLGVNVEQDSSQAERLLKDMNISFPVLFDSDSVVSKLYDVSAMPVTVMIDKDGNMRYLHKGYKPGFEDQYRQQIKELIRE